MNIFAQENNHIAFFQDILHQQNSVVLHSKPISLKKIDEIRCQVWNNWLIANKEYNEEKLISLDSISKGLHGIWNIPSNLEPDAKMPYYFGCKGIQPHEGYPFFLYIHGSGPKNHEWANGLKFAQNFQDGPSVYFVPQIPNEGIYYRWYQKSKQYIWMKLLRQSMLRKDIDPNRIYFFGISEGGYGSQRLASFYADYLAAAGPMAGGEPLKNAPAENCMNIGFSLRTGAEDFGFYRDILTRYTKETFDSLEIVYPDAFKHFIELIPNRGHSIDYRPTTPWLKEFKRNPWPKNFIWEDFEMDGMHRTGFYNLVVVERPHAELRTRYDFSITDNKINVTVHDVHYTTVQTDTRWGIEMKFNKSYTLSQKGKFIIYLNEHLVDLKKKVTIIVNGKKIFDGKIKCDEIHMLKSLGTFYDSQRIYPAAIEVEIN